MKTASNLSKTIYFIFSFIFLMYVDFYLSAHLSILSKYGSHSFPLIRLHYMENTGAAFSILQDYSFVLIIFSFFAVGGIFWYIKKNLSDISMISIFMLAFLATGICSNTYERIVFGYVRDYFELTFINFPIFNISDILINIGAIVIMCMLVIKGILSKESNN